MITCGWITLIIFTVRYYCCGKSAKISKVMMGTPAVDKIFAYKNLKSNRAHGTKYEHSKPTYHIAEGPSLPMHLLHT